MLPMVRDGKYINIWRRKEGMKNRRRDQNNLEAPDCTFDDPYLIRPGVEEWRDHVLRRNFRDNTREMR